MKRFCRRIRKVLTSVVAFVLAVTIPVATVFATTVDPKFYAAVYKDVVEVYGTSAKALQEHYDTYGEKEGRSANPEDAISKNDIRSLIIYYLAKNAQYYRSNGLNSDFLFFNADRYLAENPDVAAAVGGSRAGALEHYLTYGALEGRSSGTSFDPIVAITVLQDSKSFTPESLLGAWIRAEGKATTVDYNLGTILKVVSPSTTSVSNISGSLANRVVESKEIPNYKNDTNYTTDEFDSDKSDEDESDVPVNPEDDDPAESARYTLLAYVCGTDLETKNECATRMLFKTVLGAYNQENVNVVILAGGTDKWHNVYLNELLGERIGGINKSAIFTVDKEGLKAVVDEIVESDDSINSVDDLYRALDSADASIVDRYIEKIINANTLSMLEGSYGAHKMGDASTLVSLLNAGKLEDVKADNYCLSLWNHGGGSMSGVCFPDDKTGGLSIPEIKLALERAGYGATDSEKEYKLGFLAFDACLMAGAEAAGYLTGYYDMMYASEETTYGDVDYYNMLKIANANADDEMLSYYLANAAIEDRAKNYTGLKNALSTAAIFENGKVQESLDKFNNVARIVNSAVSGYETSGDKDSVNLIYRAVKIARLRCEQFDSDDGSIDSSTDYVDMKNFLQMLKEEFEKIELFEVNAELRNALDAAIKAADDATYANSFNYGGKRVFYNMQGSDDIWIDSEFWSQLKGMQLCGANVYVPYYRQDEGNINDELTFFAQNYAGSLNMGDYNTLISNYTEKYLKSKEERERIENLTRALISGYDNEDASFAGYADMLDMELEKTSGGEVLSIKVKDYEDGQASQYSSGDAFVDLCETMDTVLIYITRRVQALYAINGVEVDDYTIPIDVVVGSKTVSYENLNGLQNSVNIFTEQFDDVELNIVKETDYSDRDNAVEGMYDFIVPSDVEGYEKTKKDMIASLGESGDSSSFMTAKGTALVEDEYLVVYHLFKVSENGGYEYIGSTQLTDKDEDGFLEVGEALAAQKITFYHQIVDTSTNKLVYAEEYEWNVEGEGDDPDTYNYLSLFGSKEYDVESSKEITISGSALGSVGSSSDNGYYFAVSQDADKNDDDVIANVNAKGENYENADIYDSINEAMENPSSAPADEGEPSKAVDVSEEKEEAKPENETDESTPKREEKEDSD